MFKRGLKWLVKATTKKEDAIKVEKTDREFTVFAYNDGELPRAEGTYLELETAKEKARYIKKFFGNVVVLGVQTDKIIEML